MRPIPHDDSLRVPELPENGMAYLEQNLKTVLHLKPFCTLRIISISQTRELQKQNNLTSRK